MPIREEDEDPRNTCCLRDECLEAALLSRHSTETEDESITSEQLSNTYLRLKTVFFK